MKPLSPTPEGNPLTSRIVGISLLGFSIGVVSIMAFIRAIAGLFH